MGTGHRAQYGEGMPNAEQKQDGVRPNRLVELLGSQGKGISTWKVVPNALWDTAPVTPVTASQTNVWTGRPCEEEGGSGRSPPVPTEHPEGGNLQMFHNWEGRFDHIRHLPCQFD